MRKARSPRGGIQTNMRLHRLEVQTEGATFQVTVPLRRGPGRYDFEMAEARYERIAGAKTAALYSAACELGARYPDGESGFGEAMVRLLEK